MSESSAAEKLVEQERIVCAAILQDGVVYTAPHHHQIIRYLAALTGKTVRGEQGFVTSRGRYVDRVWAATLARRAGQIHAHEDSTLFSERLCEVTDDQLVGGALSALTTRLAEAQADTGSAIRTRDYYKSGFDEAWERLKTAEARLAEYESALRRFEEIVQEAGVRYQELLARLAEVERERDEATGGLNEAAKVNDEYEARIKSLETQVGIADTYGAAVESQRDRAQTRAESAEQLLSETAEALRKALELLAVVEWDDYSRRDAEQDTAEVRAALAKFDARNAQAPSGEEEKATVCTRVKCSECGTTFCGSELGECPTKCSDNNLGVEMSDGTWTCSEACFDAASEKQRERRVP